MRSPAAGLLSVALLPSASPAVAQEDGTVETVPLREGGGMSDGR